MAVRTGEQFLEGLRDDREVWLKGERVSDVTSHPKPESTERSGEGAGTGHHRGGEGAAPADMGRAGPVAGLLPVRGAAHAVAEGNKAPSLADSCGASGRDLRLIGE